MSRVRRPRRSTSYAAGHTVHWIQALHTANKPEVARRTRKGTLTAVDGDLLTIRFPGGGVPERFHNHEPRRLLAIARRLPALVSLNDDYCILRVRTHCFSVRPAREGPLGHGDRRHGEQFRQVPGFQAVQDDHGRCVQQSASTASLSHAERSVCLFTASTWMPSCAAEAAVSGAVTVWGCLNSRKRSRPVVERLPERRPAGA